MTTKTMFLLLAAGGAYYLYTKSTPAVPFIACKYPDGTMIQVPQGNACPYDMTHGGQSQPCYAGNFVGPIPPGGIAC
jgi:hypothetical protein